MKCPVIHDMRIILILEKQTISVPQVVSLSPCLDMHSMAQTHTAPYSISFCPPPYYVGTRHDNHLEKEDESQTEREHEKGVHQ